MGTVLKKGGTRRNDPPAGSRRQSRAKTPGGASRGVQRGGSWGGPEGIQRGGSWGVARGDARGAARGGLGDKPPSGVPRDKTSYGVPRDKPPSGVPSRQAPWGKPRGLAPRGVGPRGGDAGAWQADRKQTPGIGAHEMLAGRNPVIEALKAGRPINKILMQKGEREGSARMIESMARGQGVVVIQADKPVLDKALGGGFHQGVIAFVAAKAYATLDDIANAAASAGEHLLVVVADGVEDPHNLGAIIRTAEAVGAHGVVIPKRRASGLTATVAKASAGAIEHMRVARAASAAEAIKELKERGAWAIGADAGSGQDYTACDMRGDIALVVGGEGRGLGKAALSQCDLLARLPMRGRVTSLNASVAASVLMYEALRQRGATI